ncbi:phage tail assembly chaperone [Paenibacillus guangzhouensis]|uniref:phage tail assembly chaperone n=1 Tax=Paenibacillus guangzhouensis TaxID=1473112 RepID=UPI0012669457|nr:phage portal protein [Paenibacillus guangzhouensis]
MSTLSAFFANNVVSEVTQEVIVSDRFKGDNGKPIFWKIRGLSEGENSELRKAATKKVKGKGGVTTPEIDYESYMTKMIVASVVFPDLKEADLQKSYGVIGADDLLRKMLLAGEYGQLLQAVQSVNGFDQDINDLVEEVKN